MANADTRDDSSGARTLRTIDEKLFWVESQFNLIAAVVILALMLLAVVQVLGRKIFNFPVPGYVDWVEFFMAIFVFLSIAYCQKLGGHVRMEIVIGRFEGRTLYFFEIIGTLVAIFVISVLMYYAYFHFWRAWDIGDSSIDIELPIWPGKLMVVFAFGMLILRLLVQLIGFTRLLLHPDAEPIGVPIIETVDEQAQHEIDAGLAGEEEKVIIAGTRGQN